MEFNTQVKLAIYRHFAETGKAPAPQAIADRLGVGEEQVAQSYTALRASRVLFLERDGRTIRMAPPFSGVPTQHRVQVGSTAYFANCAWDALGIPAALQLPGLVSSECALTGEPLTLEVGAAGPGTCDWVFHSLVAAAHWWDDLVFT
jgi:hypothetical protein